MERLTGRKEDGCAYVIGCPEFEVPKAANIILQAVADRCADFEDIIEGGYNLSRLKELVEVCEGLEPKEIDECKFMIATRKDPEKISRLRELVQADKDGKCEIFPCKVGDIVYVVNRGDYYSRYEPYISEKEIIEINWKKDRKGRDLGFGLILKGGNYNASARYKISSIGKTIFLTREEAEVMMRKEK